MGRTTATAKSAQLSSNNDSFSQGVVRGRSDTFLLISSYHIKISNLKIFIVKGINNQLILKQRIYILFHYE